MLSKNLRKALPHLLLLSSTMLFISPASGQSLERRECEMEAQQYASQRRAELDPSPAELAAAMNQIGGVAMLYAPKRSFDMSWSGQRRGIINQCMQRKSIQAERQKQREADAAAQQASNQATSNNRSSSIPAETQSSSQSKGSELVENLSRLQEFYNQGILNGEEFNAAKRRLLGL